MGGLKAGRYQRIKVSFFYKIFTSFLVLSLVILVCIFVMNRNYLNLFENEAKFNSVKILTTAANMIDNLLYEIIQSTDLLASDEDFTEMFYSDTGMSDQDYSRTIEAQNRLVKFNNSRQFIESSFIINWSKNLVISSKSNNSIDNYFTVDLQYNKYDKDFWRSLDLTGHYYKILSLDEITYPAGAAPRRVIPVVQMGMQNVRSKNLFIINIDEERFTQVLLNQRPSLNSIIYVIDGNGNKLIDTSDDKAFLPRDDPEFTRKIFEHENNTFNHKILGKEMLVIIHKSKFSMFKEFVYVACVPVNDLMSKVAYVERFALIFMIISISVAILLSYMMSRRIYSPIRFLITSFNKYNTAKNPLSLVRDEMEYLGSEINNIMSKNIDLETNISNVLPIVCEQYMLKMLNQSRFYPPDEAEAFLSQYGIKLNKYFVVAVMQMNFTEKFLSDFTKEEKTLILSGTLKVINHAFPEHYQVYLLTMGKDRVCIVISLPESQNEQVILQSIKDFYSLFKEDAQYLQILIGIGNFHEELDGLHQSYQEALKALSSLSYVSEEKIKIYRQQEFQKQYSYSIDEENKIVNFLIGGYREELDALVRDIINRNSLRNISNESIKELYMQLFNTGLRVLEKRGLEVKEIMHDKFKDISTEQNHLTEQELISYVLELYENIVKIGVKPSSWKVDVQEIAKYIDNHYMEDIYLEQLADKFSVSLQYISKLLKEYWGMTFQEYIARQRIEKAKIQLLDTDKTVNEIAAECGYNNHVSFIRVFKKLEGVSPTQFRRVQAKNENM